MSEHSSQTDDAKSLSAMGSGGGGGNGKGRDWDAYLKQANSLGLRFKPGAGLHILDGEPSGTSGELHGLHHTSNRRGQPNKLEEESPFKIEPTKQYADGFYKARISLDNGDVGVLTKSETTMFPDDISRKQVLREVISAWINWHEAGAEKVLKKPMYEGAPPTYSWKGTSMSGYSIAGQLEGLDLETSDLYLTTAHGNYNKGVRIK